jgi:uronate dehydrogenase
MILITGAAGRLGRAMSAGLLGAKLTVRGYDLRPAPGLDTTVGTLLDNTLLKQAMIGVDVLIHLAATPDDSQYPPGDTDNFESELLPNNVLDSYRVLEAARRAGVKRVMLASTGQVVDGHLDTKNTPVTANAAYAPRYLYACTKVFLEQLGRTYAEHFDMSVLAVRFGWCPRDARQVAEIAADPEAQDVYLSPGDAGRFAVAAVNTPRWPKFAPVYCTSLPVSQLLYDLAPAEKLLGFVPQDRWPVGV